MPDWDKMSETEKYFFRQNVKASNEAWSQNLGCLFIIAIPFLIFSLFQGLFLFIGSYFEVVGIIAGFCIGLSKAKKREAEVKLKLKAITDEEDYFWFKDKRFLKQSAIKKYNLPGNGTLDRVSLQRIYGSKLIIWTGLFSLGSYAIKYYFFPNAGEAFSEFLKSWGF